MTIQKGKITYDGAKGRKEREGASTMLCEWTYPSFIDACLADVSLYIAKFMLSDDVRRNGRSRGVGKGEVVVERLIGLPYRYRWRGSIRRGLHLI
jgi:hypothetical protein